VEITLNAGNARQNVHRTLRVPRLSAHRTLMVEAVLEMIQQDKEQAALIQARFRDLVQGTSCELYSSPCTDYTWTWRVQPTGELLPTQQGTLLLRPKKAGLHVVKVDVRHKKEAISGSATLRLLVKKRSGHLEFVTN
jgi:hypothetical protein